MKILVPTKRVPDTDQRIQVRADGSGVDVEHLPHIINPFDAIALEEAIRIRESGRDAEIVAVGIGDESYEEPLRTALAMGADRALRVACSDPLDPWNTSRVLKAVANQETPDLILMGKQAVDGDCNQTGQFLAALLDWPQATFASRIECGDQRLQVDRETDSGIETVELPLPAVVTVDLRLNEPRYASLPGIMKARKKEIGELSLESLEVEPTPRVRCLSVRSVQTSRKRIRVQESDELIACIAEAMQA